MFTETRLLLSNHLPALFCFKLVRSPFIKDKHETLKCYSLVEEWTISPRHLNFGFEEKWL